MPENPPSDSLQDKADDHLSNPPKAPRKIYQPTLFEGKKRRRASPFIVVPLLLLVLGIALGGLYYSQHYRRFVPTAGEIVFAAQSGTSGAAHLWITGSGGAARLLPLGPLDASQPQFSPSGSEIAFVSSRNGGVNQIFCVDSDGKNLTEATNDPGDKAAPAWDPDNSGMLAYLSSGAVYAVQALGGAGAPARVLPPPPASNQAQDSSQLTQDSSISVPSYAWRPGSGSGLAAVEDAGDFQAISVLSSLSASPVDAHQTPQGPAPLFAGNALTLGWSPNGGELAVAALHADLRAQPISGIFLLQPNGSGFMGRPPVLVNSGVEGPQNPVFSPDGQQILFELWSLPNLAARTRIGLFLVPADGSAPPRELVKGDASQGEFSTDGTIVYFLARMRDGTHTLWRIGIDGSQPQQISPNGLNVLSYSVSQQSPKT